MSNPYASVGSVSTVTASISGNEGGPSGRRHEEGTSRMGVAAVTRRLWGYVRPHALPFAGSFVSAAASVILQLYIPILIGRGIDCIIGAGRVDFPALAPTIAQLALVVVGAAAFQWLQGYLVNRLVFEAVRELRVEANDKLSRVPMSFVDSRSHGDLISRVVNDADQVGDGLLQGLSQLFSGIVTIVGTLAFMVSVSLPMATIVALVTPLSILAAAGIARLSGSSFTAQQGIQGQLSGHIEEYVGNQRLVAAFVYGPRAELRFGSINEELCGAGERAQFLSSLSNPGTRFINNIIYAVVAVAGCACVITGVPAPLTVGGVQTFLSYANQYTKPFNEITGVVTQIQTAYASARRLFSLIDAPEEDDGPSAPTCGPARGEVVFDHVGFGYRKDAPLLHDICIHARPGERIALVGPTGCGKTTLINLLLRFYDVDEGRILVDGVDVAGMSRSDLRRKFGMVLQETWLFEGSVHDNIAYGKPGATRDEVREAARRARAASFIEALPQGYDTVIGEGGGSFSQGQRQLVCIARAMLADPAILLLDEATSSIDTRTELQVQQAFDELMRGRTSFVVAHRLSTIRDADCILVMRDGGIVERGTHDELMAAQGFYADLNRAQMER
ncbi:MAG: ABC transporter ATP-binding protein [Collinsella sp.]|nr:ABC transporter ATP-binding protein [Collinsella sp.]